MHLFLLPLCLHLFIGTKRVGVGWLSVKVAEKKKHHRCHEGQSHQLWNIHQWVGKCDGTVMTDEQATPPHSSPQSPAPLSIRAEARWTLNMYKMYWFFIWQKKGHKNHITWNCHSSFVHSSFLLMFGFCHKLSLITRYSELQSLSPQRHSHIQPAGLNKTAHIYYIWHTPRSFVSYLTNKRTEYDFTHSLFSYYTQDIVQMY